MEVVNRNYARVYTRKEIPETREVAPTEGEVGPFGDPVQVRGVGVWGGGGCVWGGDGQVYYLPPQPPYLSSHITFLSCPFSQHEGQADDPRVRTRVVPGTEHYSHWFTISSPDSFERKLEDAQYDMGWKPGQVRGDGNGGGGGVWRCVVMVWVMGCALRRGVEAGAGEG